jgi:hypothetical protein
MMVVQGIHKNICMEDFLKISALKIKKEMKFKELSCGWNRLGTMLKDGLRN